MAIPTINYHPDEIALNVYYRLPKGKMVQYLVRSPISSEHPLKAAVDFCRNEVINTLTYEQAYNLAVLAVIRGGKA